MTQASINLGVDRLVSLAWTCTALVLALGFLHSAFVFGLGFDPHDGVLRVINLNSESVLPSWYSSMLLFLGSQLALIVALTGQARLDRTAIFWFALAGLLLVMSLDESAMLHEQSGLLVQKLGLPDGVFASTVFHWLVLGLPAVLVVGAVFAPLLLRIDRRTAALFVVSGTIYVLGALGMEFVGNLVSFRVAPQGDGLALAEAMSILIEESLEMMGLTMLVSTLLWHIRRHYDVLEIRVDPEAAREDLTAQRSRPAAPAE